MSKFEMMISERPGDSILYDLSEILVYYVILLI